MVSSLSQLLPVTHRGTLAGTSLGGTGAFSPIEHGKPRPSSIERVPVPRGGLTAIRHATNGQSVQPSRNASAHPARPGVTRISSSIGEVRVNFHRVTNGLAHGATRSSDGVARGVADTNTNTVWSSSGPDQASANANNGQGDSGNGAAASAAGRGNASAVAAIGGGNANSGLGNGGSGNGGSDNAASGSGNGANGSGHGNGPGANGSGRGRGR